MATKTTNLSVCIWFYALLYSVQSFMDIEELESINYGINIVNEPIVIPDIYPESAILVTSRHGQQYQCNYPTHQEQKQQKEEEEKLALETGVVELLKPIADGPCLIKTKDWWTYEVCYGKYVRQFHMEDGLPRGDILYLGHYQSDFDWSNETLREARVRSKISSGRYHSQYYTNGSKCDLTGKGRQTEVRYLCEVAEDDYIVRVDEPETCIYVITVHSSRICSHPHLKSPTPTQPIPIVCAPLLTDQQYLQYQLHTEALRRKEEAARAKAEQEEQAKKAKEKEVATAEAEDVDIEDDLAYSVNAILKKSLGKEFKEKESAADETVTGLGSEQPSDWKVVKELDELGNLLDPQGILSNMDMSNKGENSQASKMSTKETYKDIGARVEEMTKEQAQTPDSEAVEDEIGTIDSAIEEELDEFEQEVKTLRESQAMTQKRLQRIKERVKKVVTSQFKDIIEEAEAELGSEVNEALALSQLADSLNSLLEKLENTEKEMKEMDREISNIADSRIIEKQKETQAGIKEEEKENKLTKGEESKSGVQAPPGTRRAAASSGREDKDDKDSRWKMKVRTITKEELDQDNLAKLLPTEQQKQLKSAFQNELEKAGVDLNSVKVHVKIIGATSTSDDEDDATLHVLSEEESVSFQNMIVAILGGSNEAAKEQKRQTSLEDSYNFVYNQAVEEDTDADTLPHTDSEHSSIDDNSDTVSDEDTTVAEEPL